MMPTESCEVLATLFHLSKRIRQSSQPNEMKFIFVNETHNLLPYRQAAYYSQKRGVEAISGVSNFDQHTPYIHWLNDWFSKTPNQSQSRSMRLDLSSLSEDNWSEWLPQFVMMVRVNPESETASYLFLARDHAFTQEESTLVEEWADAWFEHYQHYDKTSWMDRFRKLKHKSGTLTGKLVLISTLIAISLIPVKLSVLAPAELIALNPSIIRFTDPLNLITLRQNIVLQRMNEFFMVLP